MADNKEPELKGEFDVNGLRVNTDWSAIVNDVKGGNKPAPEPS